MGSRTSPGCQRRHTEIDVDFSMGAGASPSVERQGTSEEVRQQQQSAINAHRMKKFNKIQRAEKFRQILEQYEEKLLKWEFKNGVKGGTRKGLVNLLCSLHTIIELIDWQSHDGSKWERISLTTLTGDKRKTKLAYFKARRFVAPDKSGNASLVQQALCERLSMGIDDAYSTHRSGN